MVAMFGVWGSSDEHPAGHLVISYSNFRFGLRMPVNLLTVPGVIGSGICLGFGFPFTFDLKVNKL